MQGKAKQTYGNVNAKTKNTVRSASYMMRFKTFVSSHTKAKSNMNVNSVFMFSKPRNESVVDAFGPLRKRIKLCLL